MLFIGGGVARQRCLFVLPRLPASCSRSPYILYSFVEKFARVRLALRDRRPRGLHSPEALPPERLRGRFSRRNFGTSRRILRMRYVVTGGAGFIGSHVSEELVRRGHSVTVLDDLSSGKEANLAHLAGKVELRKGSICDFDVIADACRGADYVIHLAARTSVPRSVLEPIETNRVNIGGTLNVLIAARDAKAKRVVFAASS